MPDQRFRRTTDLRDRPDDLEIELTVDMPDAAAMPVVVDDGARLPDTPDAPGRALDAETGRQRIAEMRMPADALPVAVDVGGAVDEITDDQAAAFALRGLARGAQAPEIGPEEPRPPNPDNLPDVVRAAVFDPNRRHQRLPREPEWLTVYQLPRYLQQGIRALARSIFDVFPCFERHRQEATRNGEDALGSMRVLANLQGGGPSQQFDLDIVATWIREHGVPIEGTRLELPVAIPGYTPRVILAVSENKSYLMVDERREEGAPVDAQYIYEWTGGQVHYLANPHHMQRLGGMAEGAAPRRIEMPRRGLPPPRAQIGAAPRFQQPAVPALDAPEVKGPDLEKRKRRIAALDEAPTAPGGLIMELRRSGFLPNGPQTTPTFRRDLDDGGHAEIRGQEGVPASRSNTFEMVLRDRDGHETWSGSVSSLDEVETAVAGAAAPSP